MSSFLSLYELLDVIGTGSFGIIRKVRRKSDGLIFARKELKFERMSERDKKLIVSEVNILKDCHHEHIVRYHDRYVDREAGIMYILMEYCGGGDLSGVIKQAQRHGRPIPEDTVWNYFMQLLLALNYCHHPPAHGRKSEGSSSDEARDRRVQILHRDLKPDNVFLDESHSVKLGDFGLSKALAQTSFAQTYVGTPYYMSPELMQEKAYDSKSDIWSLGCLIYELCALKPPFHEAKTHAELSILIRNGRIPPLPKGYSPALSAVIKAMLNLNPAMRPSAAQLLQHERIDLAYKVAETQKMLNTVKTHKAAVVAKEREVNVREAALAEKEAQLSTIIGQKDSELASLRALLATAETTHQTKVREALLRREEELRQMVLKQEAEVAARMSRREEEIMDAVRRREEEIGRMWAQWERETREGMARAVDERMAWVQQRSDELEQERARLEGARAELEKRVEQVETAARRQSLSTSRSAGAGGGRMPLEEVRNILEPLSRLSDTEATPVRGAKPEFSTPMHRVSLGGGGGDCGSAMKGVIMTETGETLATPSPAEFAKLFQETPRVALNFAQIFDFDSEAEDEDSGVEGEVSWETEKAAQYRVAHHPAPVASGSTVTTRERARDTKHQRQQVVDVLDSDTDVEDEDVESTPRQVRTRLRRPSIRSSASQPLLRSAIHLPSSSAAAASGSGSSSSRARSKSRARPPSRTTSRTSTVPAPVPTRVAPDPPPVQYDLSDEENLPSPFLKKIERERITRTTSVPGARVGGGGGSLADRGRAPPTRKGANLRAMAVMNAANAAGAGGTGRARAVGGTTGTAAGRTVSASATVRSSIAKAQRASEEAKKALLRAGV
ncbi:hypothetical protein EIP86_001706 [Pleurotus ostreatoroseus]|nr:hypothetical protein EIP86_001706 [Pleurotus ostreatoroseus]